MEIVGDGRRSALLLHVHAVLRRLDIRCLQASDAGVADVRPALTDHVHSITDQLTLTAFEARCRLYARYTEMTKCDDCAPGPLLHVFNCDIYKIVRFYYVVN